MSKITSRVITDREEMERLLPRCADLAQREECTLPFQYQSISLIWWDHFNSADGTPFEKKRGRTFLGTQSRLERIYLVVAEDGDLLRGAVLLVSWSIRIAGKSKPLRVLSFAGEPALIYYQDFVVSGEKREEVFRSMFGEMLHLLEGTHDLLFLGFVPDNSPSVALVRGNYETFKGRGYHCLEGITCLRGGVQPWTMKQIVAKLGSLVEKMGTDHPSVERLHDLHMEMSAFDPGKLVFAGTRKRYEEKCHNLVSFLKAEGPIEREIEEISNLLSDAPMIYHFIPLPRDRDSYLTRLSPKTRKSFRYYKKRFETQGGLFEKVDSSSISMKDITQYLELHQLRWGEDSISLGGHALEFHKELSLALAESGHLVLFFATYEGVRIASISCIDYNNRREAYLMGRDPGAFNMIGRLLLMESIYDAIDRQFSRYELGYGADVYKNSFATCHGMARDFFFLRDESPSILTELFQGWLCVKPEIIAK